MKQTVLFVDDEEELRHATAQTLMLADMLSFPLTEQVG